MGMGGTQLTGQGGRHGVHPWRRGGALVGDLNAGCPGFPKKHRRRSYPSLPNRPAANAMEVTCSSRSRRQQVPSSELNQGKMLHQEKNSK